MKIITLSGPARGGKDYLGNLICNSLPNAKCYALADLLKEYVCELFNIDLETLNNLKNSGVAFTSNGLTMRTILQRFGTEIFVNKVDKMFWVNKLKEKIKKENYDYAIITDVRFPHELDGFGATSLKVMINNNTTIKECAHASENALENSHFDITINNKNHPDLKPFVDIIVNYLNNLEEII